MVKESTSDAVWRLLGILRDIFVPFLVRAVSPIKDSASAGIETDAGLNQYNLGSPMTARLR